MAMTVDNCRKRGTDAFLNDLFAVPSDAAPLTKRGRCSPSVAAVADLGFPLECDPIETLRLIFPHADPQVRRPCALIDQSLLPSRSFFGAKASYSFFSFWKKSFLLVPCKALLLSSFHFPVINQDGLAYIRKKKTGRLIC
jgi:hypothetical protein